MDSALALAELRRLVTDLFASVRFLAELVAAGPAVKIRRRRKLLVSAALCVKNLAILKTFRHISVRCHQYRKLRISTNEIMYIFNGNITALHGTSLSKHLVNIRP